MPFTESGVALRMSGQSSTPSPAPNASARTSDRLGRDDADARRRDHAEHQQRGAAEDGIGHRREDHADDREEAQQKQHRGDEVADVPGGDARELDEAVVLREDRVRERVEDARDRAVHAVREHAAADAHVVALVLDGEAGDHRVGRDVARGLDRGDEVDDGESDDRGRVERHAPLERHRHVEVQQRARLEMDHAEAEVGDQVADEDAEDDGSHAQVAVRRAVERDDRQQHRAGDREVLPAGEREPRALAHRSEAAAARDDADLDEAEADQGDDDAGDERGDHGPQPPEQERRGHLGRRGRDAAAEDQRQAVGDRVRRRAGGERAGLGDEADADQRTDELEARALHAEEARADGTDPTALDERADAGREERHRDEEALHLQVLDLQAARDEERRRDDRDEDREQVLEGGEKRREERRTVLDAVDEPRPLHGDAVDQPGQGLRFVRVDDAVRTDPLQRLRQLRAVRVEGREGPDEAEHRRRLVEVDLPVGTDEVAEGLDHLPEGLLFLDVHRRSPSAAQLFLTPPKRSASFMFGSVSVKA